MNLDLRLQHCALFGKRQMLSKKNQFFSTAKWTFEGRKMNKHFRDSFWTSTTTGMVPATWCMGRGAPSGLPRGYSPKNHFVA